MLGTLLLFILAFIAFVVICWIISGLELNDLEVKIFALQSRLDSVWDKIGWDRNCNQYYDFNSTLLDEKKKMPASGGFRGCTESHSAFPIYAAALLKSKKHEWLIYGFSINGQVEKYWTNKGPDRTMVDSHLSPEKISGIAKKLNAEVVIDIHNHPNPMPSRYVMNFASDQDLVHSEFIGQNLVDNGIGYIAFIAERGNIFLYSIYLPPNWSPLDNHTEEIKKLAQIGSAERRKLRRKYNSCLASKLTAGRNRFSGNIDVLTNASGGKNYSEDCLEKLPPSCLLIIKDHWNKENPKVNWDSLSVDKQVEVVANYEADIVQDFKEEKKETEITPDLNEQLDVLTDSIRISDLELSHFIKAESSWIKGYKTIYTDNTLFVLFHSGVLYQYKDVNKGLLKEFEQSTAKGKSLHNIIKIVGSGKEIKIQNTASANLL